MFSFLLGKHKGQGYGDLSSPSVMLRLTTTSLSTLNSKVATSSSSSSISSNSSQRWQHRTPPTLQHLLSQNPDRPTLLALLRSCCKAKALSDAKILHTHIANRRLAVDTFLGNWLVKLYGDCGSIEDAVAVFSSLPNPNLYSWSLLIKAYVRNGRGMEALECFDQMRMQSIKPDRVAFVCAVDACISVGALDKGRAIHGTLVKLGWDDHVVVGTALVNMYGKCGDVAEAKRVFDQMPHRNLVSWTAMISTFAQNGRPEEALELFQLMQSQGLRPNQFTFVSALDACASLASFDEGKQIHAEVVQRGFEQQLVVGSALVNMYGKCGRVEMAENVFEQMPERDVVLWNAMITAYAQNGLGQQALDCYQQMLVSGFRPNQVTFVCLLDACASLGALDQGREIHSSILEGGFEYNILVSNALINMYGKCRRLEDAKTVFDEMMRWNAASWNALMAACTQNGHSKEALHLFNHMQLMGFRPDEITMVCALDACAGLSALEMGQEIHAAILESRYEEQTVVATALVNMYGKCGDLDNARRVFTRMPHRNQVSWNTIIAACAHNGHDKEALDWFNQMQGLGIKPNDYTSLSILASLGHTGCVDEAKQFFSSMMQDHKLAPKVEHYMCLLSIFSRTGLLDDAEELILKMPDESSSKAWLCLLGACKIHGDVERGMRVAGYVFKPDKEALKYTHSS